MHIADGVMSIEVASTLGAVSLGACAYALKTLDHEKITLVAAMSALFFIASFIHIPLGPTQIHLLLLGVIGLFLGVQSFLAIAIALILQALLLGYGGLSSLGANIMIMALPAYLSGFFYHRLLIHFPKKIAFFMLGSLSLALSVLLLSVILYLSNSDFILASYTLFLANIPSMILEGILSLFILLYLSKAIPNLLKRGDT